jgi:hypothetical protein
MISMVVLVRGSQYVLGSNGKAYGIWPAGGEKTRPIQFFPNSETGLAHAWRQFAELEPTVDPNDAAQLREAARATATRSLRNGKALQRSAVSTKTKPHKANRAPKLRKPRHLGYLNVPDPDAMTFGDWQRCRGYDPKTRTYVAQRQEQDDGAVDGMAEARRQNGRQRQAAPGRDTADT